MVEKDGADQLEAPLYDAISARFDLTRLPDPEVAAALSRALRIRQGGRYLDVGCGHGGYTAALGEQCGSWVGVDISNRMLSKGRSAYPHISLQRAAAEDLPFTDGEFDGVVCVNSAHFFDLNRSFAELGRVCGYRRLVIFAALPNQIERYWLRRYFPRMISRCAERMPTLLTLSSALTGAGFDSIRCEEFDVSPGCQDMFLYGGKFDPRRYLDPLVRDNISQFVRWCDSDELALGCDRLLRDIEFNEQMFQQQETSSVGDLAIIIAEGNAGA